MSDCRALARKPVSPHPGAVARHAAAPTAWSPIQAKLRIGEVDDPLEREADRLADAVMAGGTAGATGGHPVASAPAASAGGSPLAPEARAYFEPHFGRSLDHVRVHDGPGAAAAARAIGARAFTLGDHIGFAAGEYAPNRAEGRRLIAHELAHVAQQSRGELGVIRRTVAAASSCTASTDGAPATPLEELAVADSEARWMYFVASDSLAREASGRGSPTAAAGYAATAYRRWFGAAAPAPGGENRFLNRFDGSAFPTQSGAETAEMLDLSRRFGSQHAALRQEIIYTCPGAGIVRVGGQSYGCRGGTPATSPPAERTTIICPGFWRLTGGQRGAAIVNASVLTVPDALPPRGAGPDQRRLPGCYANLALDLYLEGAPADVRRRFGTAAPECRPLDPTAGRRVAREPGIDLRGRVGLGLTDGGVIDFTGLLGIGIPLDRLRRATLELGLEGQLLTNFAANAYIAGVRLGFEGRSGAGRFNLTSNMFGSVGLLARPGGPPAGGALAPPVVAPYGEFGLGIGVESRTPRGGSRHLRLEGAFGAEITTSPVVARLFRLGLVVGFSL